MIGREVREYAIEGVTMTFREVEGVWRSGGGRMPADGRLCADEKFPFSCDQGIEKPSSRRYDRKTEVFVEVALDIDLHEAF
mgnify:CR=1 FL=1